MTARATYAVARFGAADAVRRYVPWRPVRRVAGALLTLLFLLLVVGSAVVPLPPAVPPGGGAALGFAVFVTSFALPLAVLGGAEAVRASGRTRALLAAPLSPVSLLAALFAPSLLLAAVPVAFLYGPFATLVTRQSVGAGALFVASGAMAALWSTVAGVAVVAYATSALGRERGLNVAYGVALAVLFGVLAGAQALLGLALPVGVAVGVLAASFAALVPWARSVGRRLVEAAGMPPPAREVAPPTWGAFSPWALVTRSSGLAGLGVVALLFAVVAVGPDAVQRSVGLAVLAVTAAGLPAGLAMAADHARPDLLLAAPAGRRMALRTVLRVSAPVVLAAAVAVALVGRGDWAWAAPVVAAAAAAPFVHLLLSTRRRRIAQAALLLASCVPALL